MEETGVVRGVESLAFQTRRPLTLVLAVLTAKKGDAQVVKDVVMNGVTPKSCAQLVAGPARSRHIKNASLNYNFISLGTKRNLFRPIFYAKIVK